MIFTSGLSELSSRKGIWTLGKWGKVITRPGCWTVGALVCAISVPPANAATKIVKLIFLMIGFITLIVNLSLVGCLVFQEDFCCVPMLTVFKKKVKQEIVDCVFTARNPGNGFDDRGESLPACAKIHLQSTGKRTRESCEITKIEAFVPNASR